MPKFAAWGVAGKGRRDTPVIAPSARNEEVDDIVTSVTNIGQSIRTAMT
jgi:hypothetical protein